MTAEGLGRADGARREPAATVGADAAQVRLHAVAAEGALEGADHRVLGGRRQVLVAPLAIGSQLEHENMVEHRRVERRSDSCLVRSHPAESHIRRWNVVLPFAWWWVIQAGS